MALVVTFLSILSLVSGCGARDEPYPGDASECDSLPLYERMECRERHPPLHDPINPGR